MKFKNIDERHERTVAEFLVDELVKYNLDSIFVGGDVYFTKFGNMINLGFRNRLGATFEAKRGEINICLPAYDSSKDVPMTLYVSYLQDLEKFLNKLNKLVNSLDDSAYVDVYDPSELRSLERKYSKFM